jgi:hypothetical protein
VIIDADEVDLDLHVHKDSQRDNGHTRRIVLPESPLETTVKSGEPIAVLRVSGPIPVWPVWSRLSWTAGPRILAHMQSFRERGVEVRLQWWCRTPPDRTEGLVGDGAMWAERRDPSGMNLRRGRSGV